VGDKRQWLREFSGGHERDRRLLWYSLGGPTLDPDEVTRRTGIQPDQAWRAGDPKPRTGISQPEGAWFLNSGLGESDEFHDHLDALLARMRPAWATFVDLGRQYEADVEAAIYLLEAQGPLVQLLPDVSAALAELNATLGFDLYALPAGDEEDEGRGSGRLDAESLRALSDVRSAG
jgi:hypothetical protein